jgi:hypothetical protein
MACHARPCAPVGFGHWAFDIPKEDIMAETIAVFGAAGKMGTRITDKLRDVADYDLLCVEAGEAGVARLKELGLKATPPEEAAGRADIVVLAVPDTFIGKVAHEVVPKLRSGALVICLDPAAPHGGQLPERGDVAYFVCHPCHPPVINDETEAEARADCFGGIAKQHVVAALMQGPEEDFARGEAVVRHMFAPVMNVHRVTVEQMAVLEPAMAETVVLSFMFAIREALDETIRSGVPAEAARDFLLGHMHVNLGILFGFLDAEVSDGAKLAAKRGMERLLQPDWKKAFEPDDVRDQVMAIVEARK